MDDLLAQPLAEELEVAIGAVIGERRTATVFVLISAAPIDA